MAHRASLFLLFLFLEDVMRILDDLSCIREHLVIGYIYIKRFQIEDVVFRERLQGNFCLYFSKWNLPRCRLSHGMLRNSSQHPPRNFYWNDNANEKFVEDEFPLGHGQSVIRCLRCLLKTVGVTFLVKGSAKLKSVPI